jgi:D-glycero-D-manno-heptose 1,7-bisphosphate phosphatase
MSKRKEIKINITVANVSMFLAPVLFLDLDGTVRRSKSGKTFIEGPDDIELIPGMERIIHRYREQGYLVIGISNQGGVAHGFKTHGDVSIEIAATVSLFANNPFYTIKCCMHEQTGKVEPYCHRSLLRKPDIGMLVLVEHDVYNDGFVIDYDNSLFVGDRPEDEECAKRAGITFRSADSFLNEPHVFEV